MMSAGQRHQDRECVLRRHAALRGGQPDRASGRQILRGGLAAVALGLMVTGCDGLLQSDELPEGIPDPAITLTPQGALAMYRGTQAGFRTSFGSQTSGFAVLPTFVLITGVVSDELSARQFTGPITVSSLGAEDARVMPEVGGVPISSRGSYFDLQRVRNQAGQTITLLTRYIPEQPALAGHVYALKGYAEVFLAELFCSGIPLSTLDFDGDFTYQAGSTTAEVLAHSVALFDSALALVGDSARFVALAQIGKARALLSLGAYTQAAAAVAAVPDAYSYTINYANAAPSTSGDVVRNFARIDAGVWPVNVADFEGGNGLNYRTAGDPRVVVTNRGTASPLWHPNKYATNGSTPIVLASGVEARLIEAEAALQEGDITTWLAKLNTLRTDGTQDGSGVYNPGTGGVAGLAPLTDPGTEAAQVDLLFRERAFWLFLTGHRQGDLRRLLRQYGRDQGQIYPVGGYQEPTVSSVYGAEVDAPIPPEERLLNPLFTGCASRGE